MAREELTGVDGDDRDLPLVDDSEDTAAGMGRADLEVIEATAAPRSTAPRRRPLPNVARIYRLHVATGAPTAGVAEYFKAPTSAAAKWVGTARKRGFLGQPARAWQGRDNLEHPRRPQNDS